MSKSVRGVLTLLFLSLAVPALWAQTAPGGGSQAAKVSILIDRQFVRFVAPEAQVWRLLVNNQQGELVFDSGLVHGVTLDWPLKNQQGEAVASGLYAYTLSLTDPTSDTPRTQRGHVILDRPSTSERIWVTSDRSTSLGATSSEVRLTVIGSSETTVGGAELPGIEPRREGAEERQAQIGRAHV